jgi:hypothetical protein
MKIHALNFKGPASWVWENFIGMDANESYTDVFMRFSQTQEQKGPPLNLCF